MNQFGTENAKAICHRLEMEESIIKDMMNQLSQLKANQHSEFTEYDLSTLEYSMKKAGEAVECLHLSTLNLKGILPN